jgi:cytochrome c oxidase cbb3-type subunit III
MHRTSGFAWAGLSSAVLMLSCQERPSPETPSAGASPSPIVRQIELQPGARLPDSQARNPFAGDAGAIAEGKRLYGWYNCSGCHFNGGGGIGPPLMDIKWIYGSDPENIRSTIIEGRPNGMPSYGGKIPQYQVWQIVAFVRSLGGLDGQGKEGETARQSQEPARK